MCIIFDGISVYHCSKFATIRVYSHHRHLKTIQPTISLKQNQPYNYAQIVHGIPQDHTHCKGHIHIRIPHTHNQLNRLI